MQSLPPPPDAYQIERRLKAEAQLNAGARWFTWIGVLSIINSILLATGSNWSFFLGLGTTQFVQGLAIGLERNKSIVTSLPIGTLAFVLNVALAGLFYACGVLARQRNRSAFILGMALYAFDAIIFLRVNELLSFGFHLFALYGLFTGLRASWKLDAEEASTRQPFDASGMSMRTRAALIGIALLGLPIVVIAITGPDAAKVVVASLQPPLIETAADVMNLQLADFDSTFKLSSESKQDVFIDTDVKDGNQRVFASKLLLVESRVLSIRSIVGDSTESISTAMQDGVKQEFSSLTLTFEKATTATIGDRGMIQKFSDASAGTVGYALFFLKRNILVRIVEYGLPENLNANSILTHARLVEARIH